MPPFFYELTGKMYAIKFLKGFQAIRYPLGALLVFFAWLIPFSDVLQQILVVASVCIAALLFGLNEPVEPKILWAICGAMVLIALLPINDVLDKVATLAWLMLAWIACHVGSKLRTDPLALAWLLIAIYMAAIVNSLEGLLQYFGLADALLPWVPDASERGIAIGAVRQRNLLATLLCCGVICTVWLVELRKISESLAWLSLLVLSFGFAASNSRTGALELAGLASLIVYFRKHVPKATFRLILGTVLLTWAASYVLQILANLHGFGATFLGNRFTRDTDHIRFYLWSNVVDLIAMHPWLGWGWNELKYAHYSAVFGEDKVELGGLLGHAHNLILHIAVTLGVPVAIIFSVVIGWAIYKAIQNMLVARNTNDVNVFRQRLWAFAILMVIGLHSMLEFPLWYAGFIFMTGMAMGLLSPRPLITEQQQRIATGLLRLNYVFTVGLIGLSALALTQYLAVMKISKLPFGMDAAQKIAVVNATESWLFNDQIEFARLKFTKVSVANAKEARHRAEKLLHYSPETIVIESLLSSLIYLDDNEMIQFHALRYCKAFRTSYFRWRKDGAHGVSLRQDDQLPLACQFKQRENG
jgi:O-antigen ligase